MCIFFQVTMVLIMGYSWIDGHLVTISSPGIGWPIAWKRWVLVVIGTYDFHEVNERMEP